MAFKSICTFITAEDQAGPLLARAQELATRFGAHLEVCCLGIDTTQSVGFYAGAPALIYQHALDEARARAEAVAEQARTALGPGTTRWSIETAVLTFGGITTFVGARSRFCDLAILPRPYGQDAGPEEEIIVEAALFDGNCPVLVLPSLAQPLPDFARIVLAWNQSDEALAAARAALPLLANADVVNMLVVDPPSHGNERSDPGGALAQLLVRHGCKVDISVIARTLPRISDMLSRHARDKAADLLVIGAYSHSRLRQAILGGTTRNLLQETDLPVFLAR